MINILPASHDEILAFYPGGFPKTAKAIIAKDGDRCLGVAGVYLDQDRQMAFMNISDEMRTHKRDMIKAKRIFMKWLHEAKYPTFAICDYGIEKADKFLEHLGFKYFTKGAYLWTP